MPIEETPGSEDANSYCSLEEAGEYFAGTSKSSQWAEVQDQEGALLHAALLLDSQFDWVGDKATDEQALQWPRISNDTYEVATADDEIPEKIKKAQCELALWLSEESASAVAAGAVSEMQIGSSVKVKYSGGTRNRTLETQTGMPVDALRYLKGLRIINVLA